jgi:glycerophosphoryl diester phosphodiesterase
MGQQKKIMVIAHRGGVVDKTHSENSFGALDEAVRRGYTHVEVDARLTKDGRLVSFHNDNMKSETGVDSNISDLTLEEIKKIPLSRSHEQIPTLDEFCARCANRIKVMVDLKGTSDRFLARYTKQLEHTLQSHGLLESALIIIDQFPVNNQEKIADYFLGKALLSWRSNLLYTKLMWPHLPDLAKYRFVFNGPVELTKSEVEGFHALGMTIIPSVNTQDYNPLTSDPLKRGQEDIQKMLDLGVDGLQIDSVYDEFVFEQLKKHNSQPDAR